MNTDDRKRLLVLLGLAVVLVLVLKCCVADSSRSLAESGGASGVGTNTEAVRYPVRRMTSPPTAMLLTPRQKPKSAELPPATGGGGEEVGGGGFFGTGAENFRRVIFLIDVSKSMGDEHDPMSSLGRIKREFAILSKNAKADASYLAVLFDGQVSGWPENGEAAAFDPAGVWPFGGRKRGGGTALLAAWKLASKLAREFKPEAFILLSDGAPTDCTAAEFMAEAELEPARTVKIYCVAMDGDSRLLRELATRRDGTYRTFISQ